MAPSAPYANEDHLFFDARWHVERVDVAVDAIGGRDAHADECGGAEFGECRSELICRFGVGPSPVCNAFLPELYRVSNSVQLGRKPGNPVVGSAALGLLSSWRQLICMRPFSFISKVGQGPTRARARQIHQVLMNQFKLINMECHDGGQRQANRPLRQPPLNCVLPGFTQFCCFFLGFTGFYLVLPSFTGFYLVLLGFT